MPLLGLGRLPFALAACFALSAATLTTFSVLSPDIAAELRLNYRQVGMIAAAYVLGYGLFQLPASLLALRLGSGRVLFGAVMLMSASALLPCFFANFSGWLSARLLMGISAGAVLPLGLHLLTRTMSGPRLAAGIGVFVSGWGIGMTIAMLGAAPLLRTMGWRQVMLASTLFGIVVTAALHWALSAYNLGEKISPIQLPNFATIIRRLSGNRALNLMGVVNVAGTTMMVCIPAWLPLYLSNVFASSTAETSAILSPTGLSAAVGAWAGGALTVRLGWRAVVVASLLSSSILAAIIPLQVNSSSVIAAAVLIGFVGALFAAPIQSLFPFLIPEAWTALAAAYYNTIGFLGAFFASLVFGFLVDWFGTFTVGWVCLAVVSLIGITAALSLSLDGPGRA